MASAGRLFRKIVAVPIGLWKLRWFGPAVFAGTALAGVSSAQAHPVVDICAPFARLDPQQEQELLRYEMRSRLPASQVGLIDELVFSTDTRGEIAGPEFQPGPVPKIALPPRFLHRQCLGMIIQGYAQDYPPETFGGYLQRLDGCIEAGGDTGDCTESALKGFLAGSRTPWQTEEQKAGYETLVRRLTYNAATFMLAHETAHLIIRATLTKEQLAELEEEYEADLLAQLSLIGDGTIATGPLFALASASLVAGDQSWMPAGHASYACRIARTRALNEGVLPKARWLRKIGDPGAGSLDIEALTQELEEVNRAKLLVRSSERECPSFGLDRIAALRSDVDQLAAAVAAANASSPTGHDQQALLARLRDLPLKSTQGRRLQASVAVVIRAGAASTREMIERMLAGPVTDSDKRALLQVLQELSAQVDADAVGDLSAREWGDLMFIKALAGFVSSPPGSVIEDVNRRFVDRIEESRRYRDPVADIRQLRILRSLGLIDGAELQQELAGADMVRNQYVGASMVAGDCERAQRYLISQYEALGWDPNDQPDVTHPALCGPYRAQGIAKQQSAFGWVPQAVSSP